MKFSEYPSVSTLGAENVTLVDGVNGTKKILAANFVLSALSLAGACNHKAIFRGKNLGTSITSEQKAAIIDGSFLDMWLGDYWVINGVTWRIADFDYWYNLGDTKFMQHHLVIVPDAPLANANMNTTSVTTGGYVGSQMYLSGMNAAKSTISNTFNTSLLTHREFLVNTVASGYPSAGAWYDSSIELMNELMVYGAYIYTPANTGATDVKRYTISHRQLALFRVRPDFIVSGSGYWLRDVASSTHFARVDTSGGATSTGAANSYGIRPAFAIG